MHSDKRYLYRFLEVSILVIGFAVLPAQTFSADSAPARDVPPNLRLAINRVMGCDQAVYHFRESGAGCFEARYAALGADVLVGPKGLTVRTGAGAWTLGASAPLVSANAPAPGLPRQTAPNRVEVDRGWAIEWVVNGPSGLEQGWDIPKRPSWAANEEELLIPLKQNDNLRAVATEADGRAICVRDAQGLDILRYAGLHVTDAVGRELPARFETRPGDGALWIKVTDTGAAYPITIDPWVESAKLFASDRQEGDNLGSSVALSANGRICAVGARYAAASGTNNAGAVYIFTNAAGSWAGVSNETAKLFASDRQEGDLFGSSVALSADGGICAAGAYSSSSGGTNDAGAVYIFTNAAGSWAGVSNEAAKLFASDRQLTDNLGISVALSANGGICAAGTPNSSPDGTNQAGAVYIFTNAAGSWAGVSNEAAKLFASDKQMTNNLGFSVALSVNGEICAGAAIKSSSGGTNEAGAVYIFTNAAGSWAGVVSNETAKLFASDRQEGDNLGSSVALGADGGICAVGAPVSSAGGMSMCGSVYIFTNAAGSWSGVSNETTKLFASDRQSADLFGSSVALSSNGGICAVGAYFSSPGSTGQAGAVYIFTNAAGSWAGVSNETDTLLASDMQAGDFLGYSVALSADGGMCAAGAPVASAGGTNDAGAVYVFTNSLSAPSPNCSVLGTNGVAIASGEAASTTNGTDFGSLSWGSGLTNTLSITNSGNDVLTISGVTTNGDGAAYFRISGMPAAVAGGAKSNFNVFYVPGAVGTHTAAVSIANNSTTTSYIVYLAGTCVKQSQTITFAAIPPQDVTNRLTLSATASSGLAVSFTNLAGSPVSWQNATTITFTAMGTVSIVASQTGNTFYAIAPDVTNTFSLLSALNCSVLGTNGAAIASGEAASVAKGTDFGSLPWSSVLTNTFAVTNSGSQLLTISGWTISGAGATAFTLTNAPSSVEAGSKSNFTVIFCPAGAGVFTGVLSIVNNSTNSPFAVNLAGAGYRFSPATGPAAGGNTVALTNGVLGNGSDITNIIVGGISTANIIDQAANWVRFVAPANTAGLKDVIIQSASKGMAVFYNAYTYNPAGLIFGGSESSAWTRVAQAVVPGQINAYGMQNAVYGLDYADGILYACGSFTNAGGSNCYRIAQYNGTAWSGMGGGVVQFANVNVVKAWTNGIVYAGGYFTNIGGCNSRAVAKWTGTNWVSMGNGLFLQKNVNGYVNALAAATNGYVYAGGYFTNANNDCRLGFIAQWNGSAWTNMGEGFSNVVNCLAVTTNGEVYAGGSFTNSGSFSRRYIAKWNGTAWTNVGIGFGSRLTCMAAGPNGVIYVGGWFTNSGSTRMNYVAKWDGTTWTNMGEGFNNWVYALVVGTNGEVYAGGAFTKSGSLPCLRIAKWNGTAWTNLDTGMNDSVLTLTTDANNALYAGGFFKQAGGLNYWYVAKWTAAQGEGGVNPTSGSYVGGFPVTITGTNMGNGSDITNVTLCGVRGWAIVAQSGTQVVVTAGGAFNVGVGDVCVYSESFGMTVKSNIFTYNGAPTNLPTPGGVSATYGTYTDRVRVTWSGVAGATSYDILRNTNPDVNGATSIANVPATDALRLDYLNGQSGLQRTKNEEQGSSVYYYDDYSVVARQCYYYWVRALSGAGVSAQRGAGTSALSGLGVSALSYVGMGYAELADDQTVGRSDLTVSDMVFLPVNLTNGSSAGTVSYRLVNGGPDTLVAAPVRFDFYMVQRDQADWMAYNETNMTLAVGAEQLIISDASARNGMRVRGDLTGQYTVQARVRHLDLMGDQHTGSNMTTAAGMVLVKASGVNSPGRALNDYDGDGKSDGCLYQSILGRWYGELSGMRYSEPVWIGDVGIGWTPVAGDYDGDGITDIAVYDCLSGQWLVRFSSNGNVFVCQFGGSEFIAVPGDIDGDAKTDPVVYREADGYWAGAASSRGYVSCYTSLGETGYQPVIADYDGDGVADPAVYNRESGLWGIALSSVGYQLMIGIFGGINDLPVSADYDGDGLADPAIYTPSTAYWQVLLSGSLETTGQYTWWGGVAGNINGIPVPADYDGDGKADLAVYHQDTTSAGSGQAGIWELFLSANGYQLVWGGFGGPEYQPVTE